MKKQQLTIIVYIQLIVIIGLIAICVILNIKYSRMQNNEVTPIETNDTYWRTNTITWEDKETLIIPDLNCIGTKEDAASFAWLVYNSIFRQNDSGYTLTNLYSDDQNGVWVAVFSERIDRNLPYVMIGSEFGIVFQKSDARVIKLWVGE